MVTTAASVQWTVVGTEVEALALEYSWIKEFDPRFNVKYRDDKSYPYLAVTLADEFPRVQVMRGAKRKGTRYFGPYAHAWAIRETVDLLLRVFPVRTCSAGVFKRAHQQGRPCLLGYIDKCSAPCVGRISPDDHQQLAQDFCDFMAGDTAKFTRRLDRAHEGGGRGAGLRARGAAAGRHRDARAGHREERRRARGRHRRGHLRAGRATSSRPPSRCSTCATGASAGSAAGSSRRSRTSPTPSWSSTCCSRSTARRRPAAVLTAGAGSSAVPREVLVPVLPPDVEQVQAWLTGLRGSRVVGADPAARRQARAGRDRAPQRRARAGAAPHPPRGRPDHPQPGAAGDPGGARTCRRRRCGSSATTSRTTRAPTSRRRWSCSRTAWRARASTGCSPSADPRAQGARDDTAAMHEVITRRFRRYLADRVGRAGPRARRRGGRGRPVPLRSGPDRRGRPGKPARFAYPPNLVVVDGGPPQVAAAAAAMAELGHRRRRAVRAGQAARGGVAAGGGVPGDPAAQLGGPVPAAARCATRRTGSRSPRTASGGARA